MNDRTPVLQALRLKGRARIDDVVAAAGLGPEDASAMIHALAGDDLVEEARDRFKLNADGRAELERLLAEERAVVDRSAITAAYHEFDAHNTALKELMTRWQLRDGGPNDHTDPAYDGAVVSDLVALHQGFRPLLARFVALVERLAPYPGRFDLAISRIEGGDHSWLARPLVDSYHTVWFELHEELIGLAGLTRAEEAAAGRAS